MPRIFDNIEAELPPALEQTLLISDRADFCVGYFNLQGWGNIDCCVEKWTAGESSQCCLLVGMQRLAQKGLDFIIIYNIKCRLGQDTESDDE